jgi:hypothetical protein
MIRLRGSRLRVAIAVLAAMCFFFGIVGPAGATTVLEAYEKLKAQPEYGALVQELVDTGKVTEAEIDNFVSELSERIPADVTESDFDTEFQDAGFGLILEPQHKNVLEACTLKYADQLEQILAGQLPASLNEVRDALKRELFSGQSSPGGGGGGNSTVQPSETGQPETEQPAETEQPETVPPAYPNAAAFTDLDGHWARESIEFMAARAVVSGVGGGKFAPDLEVSRAEFARMIVGILGLEVIEPTGAVFDDVPKAAWYAGAVETAYAQGLVSGIGERKFAPQEKITREQMAALIARALKSAGKDVDLTDEQAGALLENYADQSLISGWARQALAEAVHAGILKGRTAATLDPRGLATRAEAVVMLKNLLDAAGIS